MVDINDLSGEILGNSNQVPLEEDDYQEKELSKYLESNITDKNYSEFIIKTIKKTVKKEDVVIRQILYTGFSTYTFDPINLGIIAPTSEGKTYAVTQVMKFFPKEDVWIIGSMSTKVLVRQKGILVDSNNNPIENEVQQLKAKIQENKQNHDEIQSLQKELASLLQDPKRLIDLKGKILVFLEPPQPELWSLLKPILSHDQPDIEFPYVDKTDNEGIITKKVVVRGWPACIFCSARDESRWEIWPEVQSRFLITSPNMNKEKYFESNILISQRKGLPNLLQEHVIVSRNDIELAKTCLLFLKEQIYKLFISNNADYDCNTNAVWIPYHEILASSLQSNKGTDSRATNRIFSLLTIIALAKVHLRPRLIFGREKLVIANLEDLAEALCITQNVTGIPTHKIQFYREIFLELYNTKTEEDEKDGKKEKRIAVTTSQICKFYKSKHDKAITSNNLKQTYLNELLNNGYIDEEDSELDKRQKIYFPLIDIITRQQISNYNNLQGMDNFLEYSKLNYPKNYSIIPENWLKLEILSLWKYPHTVDRFQLYNKNGSETCICQFTKEYEKESSLIGYFSGFENYNCNDKIFGKLQYIGKSCSELC